MKNTKKKNTCDVINGTHANNTGGANAGSRGTGAGGLGQSVCLQH